MDKIFSAKFNGIYVLLTSMLFVCTTLLNGSSKLIACSFIYVLLVITMNLISELYNKKRALQTLFGCLVASSVLLWHSDFYINGIKVDILMGSFVAVMFSTYCGISVFARLKTVYSFHARNFISLIIASLIDSVVMVFVLMNKFSIEKIASIFAQDVIVKLSYSLSASLFLITLVYFVGHMKKTSS